MAGGVWGRTAQSLCTPPLRQPRVTPGDVDNATLDSRTQNPSHATSRNLSASQSNPSSFRSVMYLIITGVVICGMSLSGPTL